MLYSLMNSMQLRIIIVVWLGAHQQVKEKNTQKCPNISTRTLAILKYLRYPVSIYSKAGVLLITVFFVMFMNIFVIYAFSS